MTTAANLLRVSTQEQSEKNISIPAQKTKLTSFCNSKDWDIYDFYIDDGYSGKDLDRPEMQRLIKDAFDKRFDVVVVWKLDRLSRRQKDVMYLIEDVFLANDIDFASVTENIDTSTPVGRAMIGVMAVFAQLERETIVERTKMGKEEAARQGRFFGGKAILGYTSKDKKLVIDPLQADIIRRIFNLYLEGDGYGTIAQKLNDEKVPTPRGDSFWYVATVSRLLQNPTYAGYIGHLGKLFQGQHKPIISLDDWNKVQRMITQNRYRYGVKGEPELGLLRGIVYCGECGARMRCKILKPKGRIRAQYVCYSREKIAKHMIKDPHCPSNFIEAHKLERQVIEQLMEYSINPELIKQSVNGPVQTLPSVAAKVSHAGSELNAVNKKIKKWQEALENDDDLDLDEFRGRIRELKEQRHYLEGVITNSQEKTKQEKEAQVTLKAFAKRIKQFPSFWNLASNEERQRFIVGIIKRVTVYADGAIEITIL
jgi:Site-specific recombinases, DNA invertase Pin homologs